MARTVKRPRPEPQAFHQLGVRGRKTGVVLRDRGDRDEHGMQPLDSIFSPHEGKPLAAEEESSEGGGSDEMEIASSDGPGPQTLLKNRHSITHPEPKSRSPVKTHPDSAAQKNDDLSSPSRSLADDRDVTVTRKLDFADLSRKSRSLGRRASSHTCTPSRPSLQRVPEEAEDELQHDGQEMPIDPGLTAHGDPTVSDLVNESMDMFDGMRSDNFALGMGADDGALPAHANDSPRGMAQPSRAPSRSLARSSPMLPPPLPRNAQPVQSLPRTRTNERSSLEQAPAEEGDSDQEPPPREKRQRTDMAPPPRPRTSASRSVPAAPTSRPPSTAAASRIEAKLARRRGRGRPPKAERLSQQKRRQAESEDEGEGDETFMEIQRGPPMPRSRGLVSVRSGSEGPPAAGQPGRHASRGIDAWVDAVADAERIRREPRVKKVIRVASNARPSARAPRSRTRKRAKQLVHDAVEEDEEREGWEVSQGEYVGEIVMWEPEHEFAPPGDDDEVNVVRDRLAIAADALDVRDIAGATFKFAKTLTLPFMGAGVVDLPPDAKKRPKNSRKMHMVFFLHYGKVQVTINELHFRISAGGTWFVPRGNYYSITNDYDIPARIFFAQACEMTAEAQEGTGEGEGEDEGLMEVEHGDGDGGEGEEKGEEA